MTMEDSIVEIKDLEDILHEFSTEILLKLTREWSRGKHGWDSPDIVADHELLGKLSQNIHTKDWIDVAAYAMFLYYRAKLTGRF